MSASQKLKAMAVRQEGISWSLLARISPQIIALVEAAEGAVGRSEDWAELSMMGVDAESLDAALAALEDQL